MAQLPERTTSKLSIWSMQKKAWKPFGTMLWTDETKIEHFDHNQRKYGEGWSLCREEHLVNY